MKQKGSTAACNHLQQVETRHTTDEGKKKRVLSSQQSGAEMLIGPNYLAMSLCSSHGYILHHFRIWLVVFFKTAVKLV